MPLKIVCSGYLIRYPVGGFTWHHWQYLLGFQQLGHEVTYFEDYGWGRSCYDLGRDEMTADPSYGIDYLLELLRPHGLERQWCYLAEDGTAHGMPRAELQKRCRECDVYINLSNLNWTPEVNECRRRVLLDTDPVFTQIGALGMGGPRANYHSLFTFGANVHHPTSTMPTGGARWLPTRQPVVLDLWPMQNEPPAGPFTTVMNWSSIPDCRHQDRSYGQKDREFEPFFTLPHEADEPMEIALSFRAEIYDAEEVRRRLLAGGWRLADPMAVS